MALAKDSNRPQKSTMANAQARCMTEVRGGGGGMEWPHNSKRVGCRPLEACDEAEAACVAWCMRQS